MDKNHGFKITAQKNRVKKSNGEVNTIKIEAGKYVWEDIDECGLFIIIPKVKKNVTIKNGVPKTIVTRKGLLQILPINQVIKLWTNEIKVLSPNLSCTYFENHIVVEAEYIITELGETCIYGNEILAKSHLEDSKILLNLKAPQNIFNSIEIIQNPLGLLTEPVKNKNVPVKEWANLFYFLRDSEVPVKDIRPESAPLKKNLKAIRDFIKSYPSNQEAEEFKTKIEKEEKEQREELISQIQEFKEFYMDHFRYYSDVIQLPLPIYSDMMQRISFAIRNHIIDHQYLYLILPNFKNALDLNNELLLFIEKALITHFIVDKKYKNTREKETTVFIISYSKDIVTTRTYETTFSNGKLTVNAKLHH